MQALAEAGVQPGRSGDVETSGRMGSASIQKMSHSKSGQVLSWCPSCYVQFTETTLPTWTPLFATASAVVTDTGGVLSHCAIVAREYRITAVVGTGSATAAIRDGQLVEVDGTRGIVRLDVPA